MLRPNSFPQKLRNRTPFSETGLVPLSAMLASSVEGARSKPSFLEFYATLRDHLSSSASSFAAAAPDSNLFYDWLVLEHKPKAAAQNVSTGKEFLKHTTIKMKPLVFLRKHAILMAFIDHTTSDKVTELQNVNNYKNHLLSSISHELRTPLNSSMGLLQAALDDPLVVSEVKTEYLSTAFKSLKLLVNLIDDILDYSKMRERRLVLTKSSFDF